MTYFDYFLLVYSILGIVFMLLFTSGPAFVDSLENSFGDQSKTVKKVVAYVMCSWVVLLWPVLVLLLILMRDQKDG